MNVNKSTRKGSSFWNAPRWRRNVLPTYLSRLVRTARSQILKRSVHDLQIILPTAASTLFVHFRREPSLKGCILNWIEMSE